MNTILKILGQVTSATTETTLYTVPYNTSTVISTITICNRGTTQATFRVSVSVGGGTTTTKDYIYYDIIIGGNDTFAATLGITLAETDKIKVLSSNNNVSFNLFGQENI